MAIQRRAFLSIAGASLGVTAGCISRIGRGGTEFGPLSLAATTSTDDTGILAEFNLAFEARFDAAVMAIPRGTGAALRLVEDGEVDLALTHAPLSEQALIGSGHAVNRRPFMWNRFVIVGPSGDPAGIGEFDELIPGLERLASTETGFLSRGDNSGTHQREQELWDEIEFEPDGEWYQEIGQGMGGTLVQADQSQQYTLADVGTFRSMRQQLDLEIALYPPADEYLHLNLYSVVATNPDRFEGLEHALAMAYIGFITGDEGQAIIDEFTVGGESLFQPARDLPIDLEVDGL